MGNSVRGGPRRGGRILTAALAAVALALVPAIAAQAAPPKASLQFAAPTKGATVTGTVDVTFTGSHLKAVVVYAGVKKVATAVVASDGKSATAEIDSGLLRNGIVPLIATGKDDRGHPIVAATWVKVDNRTSATAPPGYRLIFSDEFSGTSLNRATWCTRYQYNADSYVPLQVPDDGCLWTAPDDRVFGNLDTLGGNGQEAEVYRDVNADGEQLHVVSNGYLALRATTTGPSAQFPYESSMIRAKQEFLPTPGHSLYLTARVKMPDVKGTWPAFWVAPGLSDRVAPDWPPEIDFLEAPFNGEGQNAGTIHVGTQTYGAETDPPPQGTQEWSNTDPAFDTEWGNYEAPSGTVRDRWVEIGAEWFTDHVCWDVDGVRVACQAYTWTTNDGFVPHASLFLNMAIGGPWAGSAGIEDAKFPTEFDVDHVRVYTK